MLRGIVARTGPSHLRSSSSSSSIRCFAIVSTTITPIPGSFVVPPAPPLDETYGRNPTTGKPGALRPTWDIPVDPKHGLWAFFRVKPKENDKTREHITVEPSSPGALMSGRAWFAAELRRKNFRDLHIIWYRCQRELNLLRTMDYNYKIWRIRQEGTLLEMKIKMQMCRKSCARIKLVLNERRLAFEDATARVRYLHGPGWKDPENDPFEKDRQEKAEIARKRRHIRLQWARIKLRDRRRRYRRKLAWRARVAKLSSTIPETTTEGASADADATTTTTTATATAPITQTTHQPVLTTRRAPRIVYPLLKKPMTQKAINKKLHRIKNRRILHPAIKSRLHLTLKANKWGRFPRAGRTYNPYVDQ